MNFVMIRVMDKFSEEKLKKLSGKNSKRGEIAYFLKSDCLLRTNESARSFVAVSIVAPKTRKAYIEHCDPVPKREHLYEVIAQQSRVDDQKVSNAIENCGNGVISSLQFEDAIKQIKNPEQNDKSNRKRYIIDMFTIDSYADLQKYDRVVCVQDTNISRDTIVDLKLDVLVIFPIPAVFKETLEYEYFHVGTMDGKCLGAKNQFTFLLFGHSGR